MRLSITSYICIFAERAHSGNSVSKTIATASSSAAPALPSLSSAPVIPTFEPPEPSQTDPYPGYYQLPSGVWAAHDPVYFAKYVKKWEAEYNAHVRALEKGMVKGFEGLETAAVEEVDAMKEMEKAKVEIREREERKAVTQGADGGPVAPKMNINVSISLMAPFHTNGWNVGKQTQRNSTVKTSALNPAQGSIRESRSFGGENCPRTKESERGGKQIWYVPSSEQTHTC